MDEGRCIYCAQLGHFMSACPIKKSLVAQRLLGMVSSESLLCPVCKYSVVTLGNDSFSLSHAAMGDSGADGNLLDYDLAEKLKLTVFPLSQSLRASDLYGRLLCVVTHFTAPVTIPLVSPLLPKLRENKQVMLYQKKKKSLINSIFVYW